MVFDANGDLWFCVATGLPGTWRRISGSTSAGSFHVLPAPARIYDSRPGSLPAVGSKTKLTNTARTLSCNVNSSGRPHRRHRRGAHGAPGQRGQRRRQHDRLGQRRRSTGIEHDGVGR